MEQYAKSMELYNHYYHRNLAANEVLAYVKILNVFQLKNLNQTVRCHRNEMSLNLAPY